MSSGNYVISLSMAPSLRLWRLWAAPKRVLWSVLRPLLERHAAVQALLPSSESDSFPALKTGTLIPKNLASIRLRAL